MYGDGHNLHDWLYVTDHCDGIWQSLTAGKLSAIYNLGRDTAGGTRWTWRWFETSWIGEP